jgi:hypothetical protein
MTKPRTDPWAFWQESKTALDELADALEIFSTHIAQNNSIELPPHTVKHAKRALAAFQENFTLMVREQKRKAGR